MLLILLVKSIGVWGGCGLGMGLGCHVASALLPPELAAIRWARPNFGFDPNPTQQAYQCHCSLEAFEVPQHLGVLISVISPLFSGRLLPVGQRGPTCTPTPHPYKAIFFWTPRVSLIRNEDVNSRHIETHHWFTALLLRNPKNPNSELPCGQNFTLGFMTL